MTGEPKQLLDFRGKTLLRGAVETALSADFYRTVAVLGANAEKFKKEIEDLPVQIAVNENWSNGMSSSIATGLLTLSDENLDAAVIMLCDQPLITAEILLALCARFARTGKMIAACRYENTIGVPALFARDLFAELMNLKADEGAKRVITKYEDDAVFIDVSEAAFDVDTLQDYENLRRLLTDEFSGK
jgi:molybdenum cofactor cytidylyltransferase